MSREGNRAEARWMSAKDRTRVSRLLIPRRRPRQRGLQASYPEKKRRRDDIRNLFPVRHRGCEQMAGCSITDRIEPLPDLPDFMQI